MISTINIWKSTYDNKWNVCMMVEVDPFDDNFVKVPLHDKTYKRMRYKFDSLDEVYKALPNL